MKTPLLLLLLFCVPVAAKEIRWTATGTVTSCVGSGLTATTGDPVTVKFAYQSGATAHVTSFFAGRYSVTYYYGPIGLSMEIKIGANTWTADLPIRATSTPEALYVEANTGFLITDTLRVTASTTNTATFPSFPYTGSGTARSMVVTLQDNHNPSLFLKPTEYPSEAARTGSINSATGSIKVGSTDAINFTIDPASVEVTTDEPPLPLFISHTPEGVKLRWPSETGRNYVIEQCERFPEWESIGFELGTGSDVEVTVAIPEDLTARRFYRVISE